VARIEVLAWLEQPGAAVRQPDFHGATEHEQPLRGFGAVHAAAEAYRTFSQLQFLGGEQSRQPGLWAAFGKRNFLVAEFRSSIAVGIKNHFVEGLHELS